jgi:anti-anti-sigma factor
MLELTTRQEPGWSIIAVTGRIDSATVARFTAECTKFVEASEGSVLLDLSGLQYVSSAGLGTIFAAARRVQERGGRLGIAGLTGLVKEIFSLSGFDAVLPTFPDVEHALAAP